MKASELRIGNYVYWSTDDVNSIINVVAVAEFEINFQINPKEIKPIPLTEEWIPFSNKTIYDNGVNYVVPLKDIGQLLITIINDGNVLIVLNTQNKFINIYLGKYYVHQFQNLCFALTGQELTIKEHAPISQ